VDPLPLSSLSLYIPLCSQPSILRSHNAELKAQSSYGDSSLYSCFLQPKPYKRALAYPTKAAYLKRRG